MQQDIDNNISKPVSNSISYACGVFTSWSYVKQIEERNMVILHFAVNRFVGNDQVHYDLPANNLDKRNKKRVALYIDLELVEVPQNIDSLSNFKFVDERFNNLSHKNSEYVLELSYTTKAVSNSCRQKEGKPTIECYYFYMGADTVINVSNQGHYLWTEDSQNTRKITDINDAVNIISNNIVKIPTHINNRNTAYFI